MAKAKFLDWKKCSWSSGKKGSSGKTFQGMENLTFTIARVLAGAAKGPHGHPGITQTVFISKGHCRFWVDGVPIEIWGPTFMDIPGEVEHYIEALGEQGDHNEVWNYDIFTPKRPERVQSKILPGFANEVE